MNEMSLEQIYSKYSAPFGSGGGDKGTAHDYIGTYSSEMNIRNDVVFLEIGVFRGDSIMMWNEYFTNSQVFGIDISLQMISYPNLKNIFVCDATSKKEVEKIFKTTIFDYIIDDGSHNVNDQIASFEIFFPKMSTRGKYFIEDILGDESLNQLIDYMNSKNIKFTVFDTRREDTTYNDIIMMIEAKDVN